MTSFLSSSLRWKETSSLRDKWFPYVEESRGGKSNSRCLIKKKMSGFYCFYLHCGNKMVRSQYLLEKKAASRFLLLEKWYFLIIMSISIENTYRIEVAILVVCKTEYKIYVWIWSCMHYKNNDRSPGVQSVVILAATLSVSIHHLWLD